jgi:hypothetical protein
MKITIISDIRGKAKSIIPYGLKLAKDLEAEVDVIHMVDTRMQQGVSSMYSDSQSVTPGNKFSHEEIMQREKKQVEVDLDKLLSSEVSRLNYPLKINVKVEVGSIRNKTSTVLNSDPTTLLIMNNEPDEYIFDDQKEIVDTCKNFNGISVIVPPGYEYQKISNVVLPTDFDLNELQSYRNITDVINKFGPVVSAFGQSNEIKPQAIEHWEKEVGRVFEGSQVSSKIIGTSNFHQEFIDFEEMIEPDMTLLFEQPKGILESIFKKDLFEQVLKETKFPVLFYSMKK